MPAIARLYRRGRIWWCWYYATDGERVRVSCKTRDRATAERFALGLERTGLHPGDAPTHQTVEGACLTLLADRRTRGRSPSTLSFLTQKAGHLKRVLGGATAIDDLTAAKLSDYCTTRVGEGASRYTVSHELGVAKAALRLARHRGELATDPAALLPVAWESGYVPRRRALTRTQFDALLRALPSRAPHLAFLAATGARLGESERARPEDWGRGVVRLRGTKTELSARVVPILPQVAALARRGRSGVPFARWPNVRRDMAAACARAKVPTVSPNDLRRSAATWLIEVGVPANLVARFLGHVDSRMVERVYGRVDGAKLGEAICAVTGLCQRRPKQAPPRKPRPKSSKRRK